MTNAGSRPGNRQPGWQQEHARRYLATGGADGHIWEGVPTLLLTTTGRRSGLARTTPLIYGRDGERYVVVASRGGAPAHPAWYENLAAQPDVEVQVMADRFRARAHGGARGAAPAVETDGGDLASLRRVSGADRAGDPRRRPRARVRLR